MELHEIYLVYASDVISPHFQLIHVGKSVSITCESSTKPVWLFNGHPVKSWAVVDDNIRLVRAYEEDSGVYTCEGKYPNGKSFAASAEILVARMYYN